MEGKQLPRVAESVLKKRRTNLEEKKRRGAEIARKQRGKRFSKKTYFVRAEKFVKNRKLANRNDERLIREDKKPEKCRVQSRGELAFVLRIKGTNITPEKAEEVLKLLRLRDAEDGVFLRLNETTLSLLQIVDPYITWGYPNLRTVKDLIYKRGTGTRGGKSIPLTDNRQIEESLGKYDVVCLEDLVHEIFTPDSQHFREVNDFLGNFHLNPPVGGWRNLSKHFKDGGDFGVRHDDINTLLKCLI